jgi:phospholipase/lecithinase/hemolysin
LLYVLLYSFIRPEKSAFNVTTGLILIVGHNSEGYRARVREWNSRLTNHTIAFRTAHPDTNVAIYNAAALFDELLDDPSAFGFRNAQDHHPTDQDVMWFDTLHPSCSVHELLAKDIGAALGNARQLVNVLNSYGEYHVATDERE